MGFDVFEGQREMEGMREFDIQNLLQILLTL
jgi:hypothetical protein